MNLLQQWLREQITDQEFILEPLQGDASFRRYYRLNSAQQKYIAVNSPPATEDNAGFVAVATAFEKLNLQVPKIYAADLNKGFFLLSDLGNDVLFQLLNKNNADLYYQQALGELSKIQQCQLSLPNFDVNFMRKELNLFQEWFLDKHLKLSLTQSLRKLLKQTFEILLDSAVSQPQCCIHRDYHSRNLMRLPNDQIGILDFQDAMRGPITYDLVSLLRDCYISWPRNQVVLWAEDFYQNTLKKLIPSKREFMRYFDLMGIQRHLKASFIFARKFHRDDVDNYLKDIPRTIKYIIEVSEDYTELSEFNKFSKEIYAMLEDIAYRE